MMTEGTSVYGIVHGTRVRLVYGCRRSEGY